MSHFEVREKYNNGFIVMHCGRGKMGYLSEKRRIVYGGKDERY